jgi:hypothetical protein
VLRKRLAVLVAAAMVLVVAASPTWAAKGGFPTEGTCGLGNSPNVGEEVAANFA